MDGFTRTGRRGRRSLSLSALWNRRTAKTYAKDEGSVTKDDVWLAIATIVRVANIIITITASATGSVTVVSVASCSSTLLVLVVASAPESPVVDVQRHGSAAPYDRNTRGPVLWVRKAMEEGDRGVSEDVPLRFIFRRSS